MTHGKKGPVAELKESLEKVATDCDRLRDDYVRALADFDNYRKRIERDLELSRRMALERLVLDLLPVLDNFDRALASVSVEQQADSVKKGMALIHRQLRDTLCRHGLEEYSCVGQDFDPRRAEAISFVNTDEQSPNTVVSESCKGYSCGGRVLRPARVVVAKPPVPNPKADEAREIAEGAEESNS